MNDIIRKLYLRGMSLATAVMLAGSLVACDETIDLPDGLISDTVSITQPSESRPNVSETLAPEDTEPEDTEPKEPEELSPELQAKYPPISEEEYIALMNHFSEGFENSYINGISKMIFTSLGSDKYLITFEHNNTENYPVYRTTRVNLDIFAQISEIAGNDLIQENPVDLGYPENIKIYSIELNNTKTHQDKINSILKIMYDLKLGQEQFIN